MAFIHDNFLLENNTAAELYHGYAADLPIFDYHCHLNATEILKNGNYPNIARVWLDHDHYKWRLMRAAGIEEKYVTGDGDDYEKFLAWAEVLGTAVGNPLYHWTHLELRRYFGIDEPLNKRTAPSIWERCNERLAEEAFRAAALLERANVIGLCTIDDPADDLKSNEELEKRPDIRFRVLPTFRPDKVFQIGSPGFPEWIGRLERASGKRIERLEDLEEALENRCRYFIRFGCLTADQCIEQPDFTVNDRAAAEEAFRKAMACEEIGEREKTAFRSEVMQFLGGLYYDLGLVMQLHLGTIRNVNGKMYRMLGPDSGFDALGEPLSIRRLMPLLDRLSSMGRLPKTILFSANQADFEMLCAFAGCFPEEGVKGRVQVGAAWWFSDHKEGIECQLKAFCRQGLLSVFAGMLTDSRSLLSMSRHEYFRRILCNLLGKWAESGEIHQDKELLGEIIKDVCYGNTVRHFNFREKR